MGNMAAVRYPAAKKCATPARGLLVLLVLGCQTKSPTEGKSVAEWDKQLREGDTLAKAQAGLALAKLGAEAAPADPASHPAAPARKAGATKARTRLSISFRDQGDRPVSAGAALASASSMGRSP